jgi:hypothetical protein
MTLQDTVINSSHPNNKLWEKLNYNFQANQVIMVDILNSGKASPRTAARMLETSDLTIEYLKVCWHNLVQVEDIITAIQRFKNETLNPSQKTVYNRVVEVLFGIENDSWSYNKRPEFTEYLKTNYDINIENMPKELIKQMLQIEDMDLN